MEIAAWALERAKNEGKDVLIVDTSGRLHVDEELMAELVHIRDAVKPHDVLLVVDAMTGQDAVNVAERFAEAVQFDGVVMSKLDGDARGGAALSVKAVTGKPILFASTGEKLDQFERFHPDRMAQRILGMGDVMSLIEKAERQFDEADALELERKLRRNEFGLDDFLDQLKMIRKMGPLTSLLGMIPGFAGPQLQNMKVDERELDRIQAIILSMTPEERRRPGADQGLAPAADRARLGHQRPAGQPPGQAVRPDAQGHAPGRARQDARHRRADARRALSGRRRLDAGSPVRPSKLSASQHSSPERSREENVAVRLRLTRVGGKKDPIWRVVVADQRSPRDGRVIETIGHYNAQTDPSTIVIDEERARSWLARGAQPSDTVRKLLRIQGIETRTG